MSNNKPVTPVVAICILRQGKVLLKRKGGSSSFAEYYCFPHGKILFGEDLHPSLRRIAKLSLGLNIKVDRLLLAKNIVDPLPTGHESVLTLYYRCSVISGLPNLGNKEGILWRLPSQVQDLNVLLGTLEAVRLLV